MYYCYDDGMYQSLLISDQKTMWRCYIDKEWFDDE
jgi:hypothetical protein